MHHPPFLQTEMEPHQYYNWPLVPRNRLLNLAKMCVIVLVVCHPNRIVVHQQRIVVCFEFGFMVSLLCSSGPLSSHGVEVGDAITYCN
jgi:hypothetical protein